MMGLRPEDQEAVPRGRGSFHSRQCFPDESSMCGSQGVLVSHEGTTLMLRLPRQKGAIYLSNKEKRSLDAFTFNVSHPLVRT